MSKVIEVLKVFKDLKGIKVTRERRVKPVYNVQKEFQALQRSKVIEGYKVFPVNQDLKEKKGTEDHKAK